MNRRPTTQRRRGRTADTTSAAQLARHDLILLGLTIVSACIDAISYLGLGKVFPANMTGNTVLLGIGLASGDHGGASRSATALGMFVVAAAAAGALLPERVTVRAFVTVLVGEVILITTLCGWWLGFGADSPDGALRYGLIALAGATMGLQSGLMGLLDVPVSTTYLTGTWTSLSAGAARSLRGRRLPTGASEAAHGQALVVQAIVVSTYVATAMGAALAYRHIGATASLIPLGVLLCVIVGAVNTDLSADNTELSAVNTDLS